MYEYHREVKNSLDNLLADGKISVSEKNKSVEDIAEAIEEPIEFVENICAIATKYALEYDVEKIVA